ncbi:MAG: beta-ketoacyl-ACP synthase II [Deltaproteobacteria bacterium]|nr:beta-ketoacyl-ACP synthase II [Deltaproteobacteria bacterium]
MKRIVVTGVGAVTPVGLDARTSFENIVKGKSGIGYITKFDASNFRVRIAGEVKDFNPDRYVPKKDVKKYDLFSLYAIAATKEALDDAGIETEKEDKERIGVSVGSGIGGLPTIEKYKEICLEKGEKSISPFFIPLAVINMASCDIAIMYGFKGPNFSDVTACATGAHSIGLAMRAIQYGDADIMIAGGTESAICPLAIGGFSSMRALSTRNDEPEAASRPFDRDRDGFIVSEGAGVVILEEYEHAKRRGAEIYAELCGFGMSCDAYHITAPDPDGEGASLAMENALKDAHCNLEDVDYINAHGTSTHYNDIVETRAIKKLFKEHAYKLCVSSNKSQIGHLLGAAGGVEAVFTVLTVKNGIVPPTINLEHPDPECDLNYVPNVAQEKEINVAMNNSFGFGGTNAVLVFRKL